MNYTNDRRPKKILSALAGGRLRPPQWTLQKSYNRNGMVSPLAHPPFILCFLIHIWTKLPVIGSVFINLPSIWLVVNYSSTYQQQKDVSGFFSHSKYWWATISRKSLITILKTTTAIDNHSVIVIATNS